MMQEVHVVFFKDCHLEVFRLVTPEGKVEIHTPSFNIFLDKKSAAGKI